MQVLWFYHLHTQKHTDIRIYYQCRKLKFASFFLYLSFPLLLSLLLSLWLLLDKEQNEIQMFPFLYLSLTTAHSSAEVDLWNEKIYIQKKKHQTKQKFMAIWIFEQKMKSTHTHHIDRYSRSVAKWREKKMLWKRKANECIEWFTHINFQRIISMKF